jgi:hypothetical protein
VAAFGARAAFGALSFFCCFLRRPSYLTRPFLKLS